MAKRYTVLVPISGCVYVDVIAESEDEAVEKAVNGEVEGEYPDRPEEWESHRHITQGNVCYAMHWEAEVVGEQDVDE
jgi:hypothetical protein